MPYQFKFLNVAEQQQNTSNNNKNIYFDFETQITYRISIKILINRLIWYQLFSKFVQADVVESILRRRCGANKPGRIPGIYNLRNR